MNKGRELDALIAEKVMGLEVVRNKKGGWSIGPQDWFDVQGDMQLFNPLPSYSEDITYAFEVVEIVKNAGWYFHLDDYGGGGGQYMCVFDPDEDMLPTLTPARGIADGAPHAICLAALKAVGYE